VYCDIWYIFLIEGKKPHGIFRRRWEDNIKMYLKEVRREGVDWIYLGHEIYQWRVP
jgi:hypothetical protein